MQNKEPNLFLPIVNGVWNMLALLIKEMTKLPNNLPFTLDDNIYYTNNIRINIGKDELRRNVYLNIGDSSPHTLIGGITSGGKSNLIKIILTTIVNNYPNVKLFLLDYKRVELSLFKSTVNCMRFEWSEEGIESALEELYQIVLNRYEILESQNTTKSSNLFFPIVFVIEECILLSKKAMQTLKKILVISRAVSVYGILTIQRAAGNDTINPVIKSLLSNRISFKMIDSNNSNLILDSPEAKDITQRGECYFRYNDKLIHLQTYFIKDSTVKDIVDKHKKDIQRMDNNYTLKVDTATKKKNIKIKNKNVNMENKSTDTSWIDNL